MKTTLGCELQGQPPRQALEAGLDFLRTVWPSLVAHCCYDSPECTCRHCDVFPDKDQQLLHRFFPESAEWALVTHDEQRLILTVNTQDSSIPKRLAALPCWSRTVQVHEHE